MFCNDLAHLYSHLSKPMLDVVLMTTQLIMLSQARGGGEGHSGQPLLLATGVIVGTGYVLKLATPPFGKLIAEQARLYGELRAAHSRVITHAEEIGFYSGEVIERGVLQQSYDDLIKHINYIYRKKIWYTMLEQFLMRYVCGACLLPSTLLLLTSAPVEGNDLSCIQLAPAAHSFCTCLCLSIDTSGEPVEW